MAPQVGLEPTTPRLTAECSTIELLRSKSKLDNNLFYSIGIAESISSPKPLPAPKVVAIPVVEPPKDRDGDGIIDSLDACPDVAGLAQFKGCPDTDGDGIPDKDDKCPNQKGLAKYNGCPIPDTDGDGINDEEDKCPTVAGVAKYNGCPVPDTDKDGVDDEHDSCKTIAGIPKYHGCPIPDTDNDGINDEQDKCPTVAGVAKYNGCPIPDTDGDGVNDELDKCPTLAGTAANNGCPEIKAEVKKRIEVAAKKIYFATGSAKLLTKSNKSLDEVANILKADQNLKLDINGFTDNTGKADKNKTLSENRANAVTTYLTTKGVDAGRLMAAGYGQEQPVADNKTAAGRAKNRRVEMTVRNF